MAKAKNAALTAASKAKEDEFYTQITDIEKELRHYKEHFKGKIIFCNCDDPETSNFWRYFKLNYGVLGLKKLVSTHYEIDKPSYKLEYSMIEDKNGQYTLTVLQTKLKQNGDFRSLECIDIMKEADIIVTNPPFSLFREYVAQLIEYNKFFLIIGNQNNITYKEIFPLLMNNKIWLGYNSGDMEFTVPDYYKPRETRFREDETGQKYRSFGNMCWFTNLDIRKRHEEITLYKLYNKEEYPTYDNYNAIEVSRVSDVPVDYNGIMGVPITFLEKFNPEQFEILGITDRNNIYGLTTKIYTRDDTPNFSDCNRRAAIKKADGTLKSTYARILIRRKM